MQQLKNDSRSSCTIAVFRFSSSAHCCIMIAVLFIISLITSSTCAQIDDADRDPVTGRRISDGQPVVLAFKEVAIRDILEFIVETTGKTVIPDTTVLSNKITIVNDIPLSRDEALNQLFLAFLNKRVGVVETRDVIRIEMIDQIGTHDCPVIGPNDSLADRRDDGVIINKIFTLRHISGDSIADLAQEFIPEWGKVEIEAGSNSIIVMATIGIAKKIERLIDELDKERPYDTRTFYLNYADPELIADWIMQLYSGESGAGSSGGTQRSSSQRGPERFRQPQRPTPRGGGSGDEGNGITTTEAVADIRNNSVTVKADPVILEDIENRIRLDWDKKPSPTLIKTYTLHYRDVIRVRDILNSLSGTGSTSGAGGGRNVPQPGGASAASGAGGSRLSSLFTFEADPGNAQLIVIAKTDASFEMVDQIIEMLDQPNEAGAPLIIELNHADAYELALEINAVLANRGIRLEVEGRQDGLTAFDPSSSLNSDSATNAGGGGETEAANVQMPWMLDRATQDEAPVSPLIGKVRIMPISRQNALLVLGPPHYQKQIAEIIQTLDKPRRQVLISAVIAEVELGDEMSLGIRWGRSDVFGAPTDNQLGTTIGFSGTDSGLLDRLFDTTVLDVSVNIAAMIEALQTTNNVRVVSEPRVFTRDNEQANFFDGQRIQVVTSSVTDITSGNINSSFEMERAGLVLSVRPRITANREVDLTVSLELSSLLPTATTSGGLIFDDRRTETRVTLRDGQTVIISGIMRELESDVKRKVPFLGDIPLLGAIFTSTDRQKSRSELIAFITPIVVDNPNEVDELTQPWSERLDDMNKPLDKQVKEKGDKWRRPWELNRAVDHSETDSEAVRNDDDGQS